MLLAHTAGILVFVTIASRQKYTVVPDYYAKGLSYDQHKAKLLASQQLGWVSECHIGSSISDSGKRSGRLVLVDAQNVPIRGAVITLSIVHPAHPERIDRPILREVEPGVYEFETFIIQPGNWDFDLSAERGEQLFLSKETKLIF
jgi:nitrogen fixation protein FixH